LAAFLGPEPGEERTRLGTENDLHAELAAAAMRRTTKGTHRSR
jgi:hypothetical protein